MLIFIPLLWEHFRSNDFNFARSLNTKILPIFLIPLGTLGFFIYHRIKFGDFFLFFKVESWWGRAFSLNTDHFFLFSGPAVVNLLLDVFFVVIALAAIYFVFKKLRTSYGLYMLTTMAVVLCTGTLMSMSRYILVLFPLYILLASIKNQYIRQAWVFVSILLLAMYTILFVNNYWAG